MKILFEKAHSKIIFKKILVFSLLWFSKDENTMMKILFKKAHSKIIFKKILVFPLMLFSKSRSLPLPWLVSERTWNGHI